MMIVGCFDYVYPFSAIHHQTQFVYEVDRTGPNNTLLVISPIGTTPQNEVQLMLNPQLAGDAD